MISKGQMHIEMCYLRRDFLCKPTPILLIILPVVRRGQAFRRVDDGPSVAFVLMSSLFLLQEGRCATNGHGEPLFLELKVWANQKRK